ncbi:MAG: hypothetical protein EA418_13745 [Wenzhouxiangellaceae bacterium]|nr:MAG: hypothetical protein EA418_13745 [Wenzhouxiangellaceae bacterium]
MIMIPAGIFTQGSPVGELQSFSSERPQREVNVPAFAMGQTVVTFAQWDACVADGGCTHNPGDEGWGRGNRPVIDVSWNDAQEYVTWLSDKTGREYRLPSESEWEYAARAGSEDRFHTGECIGPNQANFQGGAPATDCPGGVFRRQTLPVASFNANDWGLHDMHGNVWEWVKDCWNGSYWGSPPENGSAWLAGNCFMAGLRGGSWAMGGRAIRSASRAYDQKSVRNRFRGFRVAAAIDGDVPSHVASPTASSQLAGGSTWWPDDLLVNVGRIVGPGVLFDERNDVVQETLPVDAISAKIPTYRTGHHEPSTHTTGVSQTEPTNSFVSASGRALLYRYAIQDEVDITEMQPMLIHFHGNNTGSQDDMLDMWFNSTVTVAEERGLVPVVVASPETRNPPQEEVRQWMAEDRQLLHEFLQHGVTDHLAVDHDRIYFDGGSQGTCFLHDFMQSHGEHYGGGFYGGCGCYNSPDPTWDPPEAFKERMKVYIHNTTGDFLFEHGKRGYAYYKYTIGLDTRGDLDQDGSHCALNWQQRRVALDWFTGVIDIPEEPFRPHWSRISTQENVVGMAVDGGEQAWKLLDQPESDRAVLYRQASSGQGWQQLAELQGQPQSFTGYGQNLFMVIDERLHRTSDGGQSILAIDPSVAVYDIAVDGAGVVYRSSGHGLNWSDDAGNSWKALGGPFWLNMHHDAILTISDPRIIVINNQWDPYLPNANKDGLIAFQDTPSGRAVSASWDGAALWAIPQTGDGSLQVFRSSDEGQSWQEIALSGAMTDYSRSGMRITALGSGKVLVHGGRQSARFSEDHGETWQRVPGLETGFSGAISAYGDVVLFTDGEAAFQLQLDEFSNAMFWDSFND